MDIKKREILFLFGEKEKKNMLFLVSFFVFFTSGLA